MSERNRQLRELRMNYIDLQDDLNLSGMLVTPTDEGKFYEFEPYPSHPVSSIKECNWWSPELTPSDKQLRAAREWEEQMGADARDADEGREDEQLIAAVGWIALGLSVLIGVLWLVPGSW